MYNNKQYYTQSSCYQLRHVPSSMTCACPSAGAFDGYDSSPTYRHVYLRIPMSGPGRLYTRVLCEHGTLQLCIERHVQEHIHMHMAQYSHDSWHLLRSARARFFCRDCRRSKGSECSAPACWLAGWLTGWLMLARSLLRRASRIQWPSSRKERLALGSTAGSDMAHRGGMTTGFAGQCRPSWFHLYDWQRNDIAEKNKRQTRTEKEGREGALSESCRYCHRIATVDIAHLRTSKQLTRPGIESFKDKTTVTRRPSSHSQLRMTR